MATTETNARRLIDEIEADWFEEDDDSANVAALAAHFDVTTGLTRRALALAENSFGALDHDAVISDLERGAF